MDKEARRKVCEWRITQFDLERQGIEVVLRSCDICVGVALFRHANVLPCSETAGVARPPPNADKRAHTTRVRDETISDRT